MSGVLVPEALEAAAEQTDPDHPYVHLRPEEVRAIAELARAAEAVDSWWVIRSIREGDPLDGETGSARVQALRLHEALAPFVVEEQSW